MNTHHDDPFYIVSTNDAYANLTDDYGNVLDLVADFARGYAEALLWANTSTDCECLTCMSDGSTLEDHGLISDDFAYRYQSPGDWFVDIGIDYSDAIDFLSANLGTLSSVNGDSRTDRFGFWDCHGHDFALTRNGHGTGFWDRGYGHMGDVLTDACHPYGAHNLYIDADDKIWNE